MKNKIEQVGIKTELVRTVVCSRRWRGCFNGKSIEFVSHGCYFVDGGRHVEKNIESLWGVMNSHRGREYEEAGVFHRLNEDGMHFIYNAKVKEDLEKYQECKNKLELARYYPRDSGFNVLASENLEVENA